MQGDLDRLNEGVVKWQMDFNINKCKVMNIGMKNPQNRYNINRIMLNRSECDRDLGVQISSDRPRKQCIEASNRANRLGFIARSIKSKSAEVILKLYLALLRLHLDYAGLFWSPYYKMDIILLESVQRRMTKII